VNLNLFAEVHRMHKQQQGPLPASAVIWVGFVCDLWAYGLVDSTADLVTHGKS
jgi:hypothetical protein